jgi:hypothetical protein
MGAWRAWYDACRDAAGGPVRLSATAVAAGLDPSTVRRRANREGFWRPFPDVIGPPGAVPDADAWCKAALLHLGADDPDTLAGVTRNTALWLYGIRGSAPTAVQATVPAERTVVGSPRLSVVRSRCLPPDDLTTRRGIRTVTPARLVRDLAPVTQLAPLRSAAIDLVQQRQTTLAELWAQHDRGRFPGRPLLRRVLAELDAAGRTDSPLELRVRDGLSAEGIPLDRGQVPVPLRGGARIHLDLGVAAIRFGIEVDSMGAHSRRWQVTKDAQRANALARVDEDWRVLHATWEILERGWGRFTAEVREVVAAQSRRHLGVPWPRPSDLAS